MFESNSTNYIPALKLDFLTPFFDPFLKYFAKESVFKLKLVEQVSISSNEKVLDLGCGTGTLAIMLKQNYPGSELTGVDVDPKVLEIAKKKAMEKDVDINFNLGTCSELPYPDNYFDVVTSSLMFHHLTRENKIRTLQEIFRVLKPHGELHVADLGKPQNFFMYFGSAIIGYLEEGLDNMNGLLPKMFKSAGFKEIIENDKIMTLFGTISLYRCQKIPKTPIKFGAEKPTHFNKNRVEIKFN